ncbi:hypothetical protein HGP28_02300 [Vibrio sp. SM6]|uniref:Uncharacterized protein n=1 Tax=Vibrio agarilyticus TaxID=2726741 RepID=A0A7X8TNA1_9VIBR|nr:hypothetical protein [Vibrio agarilyticus]NLS11719.1 hypothetical protein [Vibrio agarilyticus]
MKQFLLGALCVVAMIQCSSLMETKLEEESLMIAGMYSYCYTVTQEDVFLSGLIEHKEIHDKKHGETDKLDLDRGSKLFKQANGNDYHKQVEVCRTNLRMIESE